MAGLSPIVLVSLAEEIRTQTQEGSPCEDTGRKQASPSYMGS